MILAQTLIAEYVQWVIPSVAGLLLVTAVLFYHLGHADGYSKATNLWRKK